jgi:hypothetical protein
VIAAHRRRAPKRKNKKHVKVAAEQIVLGNGSSELEQLLTEESALSLVKERHKETIRQLKEKSTLLVAAQQGNSTGPLQGPGRCPTERDITTGPPQGPDWCSALDKSQGLSLRSTVMGQGISTGPPQGPDRCPTEQGITMGPPQGPDWCPASQGLSLGAVATVQGISTGPALGPAGVLLA